MNLDCSRYHQGFWLLHNSGIIPPNKVLAAPTRIRADGQSLPDAITVINLITFFVCRLAASSRQQRRKQFGAVMHAKFGVNIALVGDDRADRYPHRVREVLARPVMRQQHAELLFPSCQGRFSIRRRNASARGSRRSMVMPI